MVREGYVQELVVILRTFPVGSGGGEGVTCSQM